MDYQALTDEHKREILSANLLQVESEHFELSTRLAAYDGARDVTAENKAEMTRQTQERLASLEAAIAVYRERLAELGEPSSNGTSGE
ncbi:MAG: hypothetical protein M3340_02235 [Actinomycetota bacterium]|nr:hypothetical protein [Actinomycetota bacterium]